MASSDQRPMSLYDNLSGENNNSKRFPFSEIQFKFDDGISPTVNNARKTSVSVSSEPQNGKINEKSEEIVNNDDISNDSDQLVDDGQVEIVKQHRETGNGENGEEQKRSISISIPESSGQSQVDSVYMSTTVPQNFGKNDIIGRHKPTRSSLRHSRMLVVNKNYHQRFPKHNSLNLDHIRFCRTMLIMKIVLGFSITSFGLFLLLWSPSTETKDNPYWSGTFLVLSGSLFLGLLEFRRISGNRLKENLFYFLKINSIVILMLTVFFTMLAFVYALINIVALSSSNLSCKSDYEFSSTLSGCTCFYLDATISPSINSTVEAAQENSLIFRDFNCEEVHGVWFYLVITSAILNLTGCILASVFLVILVIRCRQKDPFYMSVKTNNPMTMNAPSLNTTTTTEDTTLSSIS